MQQKDTPIPTLYRASIVENGRELRSVKGPFTRVMAWALKNGPRTDVYGHPLNDSRVYVLPATRRMPWEVPSYPGKDGGAEDAEG